MYKIRLNDGTEYPVKYCTVADSKCFMTHLITDAPFITIATVFSDASKTRVMQFLYDHTTETYEGYTVLQSINVTEDGDYIISLKAVI